jgi:WD40 repeat protein
VRFWSPFTLKLTLHSVVKVWDLGSREEVWKTTAAENVVKSMAFVSKEQKLLTASADKTIKLYDPYNTPSEAPPIHSWLGSHPYTVGVPESWFSLLGRFWAWCSCKLPKTNESLTVHDNN